MTPENPTPPDDADEPVRRRAVILRATAQAGAVVVSCAAITFAAVTFTGDDDGSLRSLVAQGPFGALLLPPPVVPGGDVVASGGSSRPTASAQQAAPAGRFGAAPKTTMPLPAGSETAVGDRRVRRPMLVTTVTGGRGIGRPAPTPGSISSPVGAPAAVGAADGQAAGAADDGVTLLLDDGREGLPEIALRQGRPGSIGAMTIRVRNTGPAAAPLVLSPATIVDRPGPLGGLLSTRLLLRVLDEDGGVRSASALASVGTLDLGFVPAGGTRTWRIELEFPDGGTPPSPTTGDNVFQGAVVDAVLEIAERVS
jgi:hypothetical protein